MLFQFLRIQFKQWVTEHPDRDIYEALFSHWECCIKFFVQLVGQLHIVLAVLTILRQLLCAKVLTAQPLGIVNLKTFDTQSKVLDQLTQTAAHLRTQYGPCHRQRIQPCLGFLPKHPCQDGGIKHSVMG